MSVHPNAYVTDQPIRSGNQDRFGRSDFANRVAQVIAQIPDPNSIALGIYAPWGGGKTSVLNMIIEALDSYSNTMVIRFNPWRFHDEGQLLTNFFSLLAEKVAGSLKTRGENVTEILNKYAGVLAPFSLLGINAKETVQGLASLRPVADIEEQKRRIEELLSKYDKRIVIIMDDIDRLDREEIQAVFKLVKLSGDFPNTAYVLAFDSDMVAQALSEKYGSVEAGRNFLEKIIQIPLPLPPASIELLRSMIFEGIQQAFDLAGISFSPTDKDKLDKLFGSVFENHLETPRLAKRFVNGLAFLLPLMKDEVNALDLVMIESIRVFYPRLYSAIRDNPASILGIGFDEIQRRDRAKVRAKRIIDEAMEGMSLDDRKTATKILLEMFPRLDEALTEHAFPNRYSDSASEKSIASDEYFHRYFTYGVPTNEISDKQVTEAACGGEEDDIQHPVDRLRALAKLGKHNLLLKKLSRVKLPTEKYCIRLVKALTQTGELYPRPTGLLANWKASPSHQAWQLACELINTIKPDAYRHELALDVARNAGPLPFAAEYIVKASEAFGKGEKFVTAIQEIIAERIAKEDGEGTLLSKFPQDAYWLYRGYSFLGKERVVRSVSTQLLRDPGLAITLLTNIISTDKLDARNRRITITDTEYKVINNFVRPSDLMRALRTIYTDLDDVRNYPGDNDPIAEHIAWGFATYYRSAPMDFLKGRIRRLIHTSNDYLYGFINYEEGGEVYFNKDVIDYALVSQLNEGDEILFEMDYSDQNPRAKRILRAELPSSSELVTDSTKIRPYHTKSLPFY